MIARHQALAAGLSAVERNDWVEASAAFEAVIEAGPSGEAQQGLATALFWQGRTAEAFRAMERAYSCFRNEGAAARAAWAALWLAGQYMRVKGNQAAARGWASRCERLLAGAEPCAELGRAILVRALAGNDWTEIERAAERAAAITRRFGDTDYELLAIAYGGLAMVSTGRSAEGLRRLDEAMAAASAGEVAAPEAVGQIYCALLAGCEWTADFRRAEEWSRVARPFLTTYDKTGVTGSCRALYAGVLMSGGRWPEAEAELWLALETFDAGAPAMRADALVRLAELRVRQGRLDEAAMLLEGNDAHPEAQRPLAGLELARGRPRVAAALIQRRLHQLGGPDAHPPPLVVLLVEALIAAGDVPAATAAAAGMTDHAPDGYGMARGLAGLASGLASAARGDDPVPILEPALARLTAAGLPWEAARARLAIAEAEAGRNLEFAVREARQALGSYSALGARPGVDRAAGLLRRLGVPAPSSARSQGTLSRREEEVARLVGLGLSNDRIAAQLCLSPRTVEHHVTSILRKLDVASRAEIAAYAARRLGPEVEPG